MDSWWKYFDQYVAEVEVQFLRRDRFGFYKLIQGGMGLQRRKSDAAQYIRAGNDGTRRKDSIATGGHVFPLPSVLNTKSVKLDPTLAEQLG